MICFFAFVADSGWLRLSRKPGGFVDWPPQISTQAGQISVPERKAPPAHKWEEIMELIAFLWNCSSDFFLLFSRDQLSAIPLNLHIWKRVEPLMFIYLSLIFSTFLFLSSLAFIFPLFSLLCPHSLLYRLLLHFCFFHLIAISLLLLIFLLSFPSFFLVFFTLSLFITSFLGFFSPLLSLCPFSLSLSSPLLSLDCFLPISHSSFISHLVTLLISPHWFFRLSEKWILPFSLQPGLLEITFIEN